MTRRRFLAGAAAATSALALSGCRTSGLRPGVSLRFWNGFTGPDGRRMLALVKEFSAAHPTIRVSMQRMEWRIYYNKLLVAGLDRRAPEVFVSHASAMARLADGGFLAPVDDLLAAGGLLDAADFDPNILAAAQRRGQTWGIPLDVHPIGMYYNRTMLRDAGLRNADGTPRPPTTAAEFIEALRRLRRREGPIQENTWGFVLTWLRTNTYSVLRQWGGDIFAPDGVEVILDSKANAEALTFLVDLIHRDDLIARPQDGGGFIGFRQARVGMVFEGIYMLEELRRQSDLDYGAAPLPQLGPQPAAWADSHLLCIAANLDRTRRAAAEALIRFLSDHSLRWADAGQVPARRSRRATPEFQQMAAQAAFAQQLPYVAYMPRVPYVLEYQSVFDVLAERALRARARPEVCLRAAADELRRVVQLYQSRRRTR